MWWLGLGLGLGRRGWGGGGDGGVCELVGWLVGEERTG